jgi:hypothetical protein
MVDVVGFVVLLSVSSVVFCFHLLCSRNSLMDGGAVIAVLAVSPLAVHPTSYPMGTGGKADHSPPASAEVKKMWNYTSTPP